MSSVNMDLLQNLGLSQRPEANTRSDPNRLGQPDFLRLMVAQLENQDPFQPMESGEFLGQLAQFGTVSGIEDLQRSFREMASSLVSNQALQAASLVERQVLVPGNSTTLSAEGSISGAVELAQSANLVSLGIYDSSGNLVRRLPMGPQGPGMHTFAWDGMTDAGTTAAPGRYRIEASALNTSGMSLQLPVYLDSRVESVAIGGDGGQLKLQVEGVGEVEFSKVRGIS